MLSFRERHDDLRHLLTNPREFADCALPMGMHLGISCEKNGF